MRVLLLADDEERFAAAFEALSRAGHEVVSCHEPGSDAWPCAGIEGQCPVDDGVDVTVTLRHGGEPRRATEDGVACAVRHRIPLVVAGDPTGHPFGRWAAAEVAGAGTKLVETVEAVGAAPSSELSALATAAARTAARQLGLEGAPDPHHPGRDVTTPSGDHLEPFEAEVFRQRRNFRVVVRVPTSVSEQHATAVAERAWSAVRQALPDAATIDVTAVRAT